MFWMKRKKQLAKQSQILDLYLSGAVALLSGRLDKPVCRAATQVFILGMVDMLRHAQKLSMDDFVSVYDAALKTHGLLPSIDVGEFVAGVGQIASSDEAVAKVMQEGAQSISMFISERDAQAPIDLSRAVIFAESNETAFAGIVECAG